MFEIRKTLVKTSYSNSALRPVNFGPKFNGIKHCLNTNKRCCKLQDCFDEVCEINYVISSPLLLRCRITSRVHHPSCTGQDQTANKPLGMAEWLARVLRNYRVANSTPAYAIIYDTHGCEQQMNEIELNLVLAIQDPGVIKRHY